MVQIHLMMMKTENKKSTFGRTSMGLQQDLSWQKRTGREFRSTHSRAVADCWVGTGLESSSAKLKKATHGAVCASRIITWGQKTLGKSTQRCSSEEARNASDQNATWKCVLSSGRKKENTWMWRMWVTFVTTVSQAELASQVTRRCSTIFIGRSLNFVQTGTLKVTRTTTILLRTLNALQNKWIYKRNN